MNKKFNRRGAMALSQIFILIIGIVAISYTIGSEVGMVSGMKDETKTTETVCYKDATCVLRANCDLTGYKSKTGVQLSGTPCKEDDCKDINNCVCCWIEDRTDIKKQTTTTGDDCEKDLGGHCLEIVTNKCPDGEYLLSGGNYHCPTPGMCCKKKSPCPTERECCEGDSEYIDKHCPGGGTLEESLLSCVKGVCMKEQADKKDELGKTKTPTDEKLGASYLSQLFKAKEGSFWDGILTGFQWGGIVYGAIKFIGPMFGFEKELVDAASIAAFAGVWMGGAVTTWLTSDKYLKAHPTWTVEKGQAAGAGVGAAVGIILFILLYEKDTQEAITFTCYPWDAPTGGADCEKCNQQGVLPCSEYQCRSLGQACQLLNPGTKEEKCAWVNKNDVKFPTIEPLKDALLKGYTYTPDNTISPPDRGVKIVLEGSTSGCVKAFTPLSFGITLDEPAKCKIDSVRKKNFDDMNFYLSGGLSLYNHSYIMSLPGPGAFKSENITIKNDGKYELYVRCQDANGNSNTADFGFGFCVEKGPDTTPPLIVTTNPLNGRPIASNQTLIGTTVYINEPADCKWSHLDQDYNSMEGNMSCSSSVFQMNAQMLYTCDTTLTGLKDKQENKFYFRCVDKAGNANKESYKFSLTGTKPLVISWVKPENGSVISDSTDSVKVTLESQTSAGYKDGEANCYYSDTGETEDYVMFLKTSSYQHSQDLWLPKGKHTYFIKCIDLGGNTDIKSLSFTVESDSASPIIIRAYHDETYLKLVTDEPARCVYDTKYENYPCDYSFEDGIEMKVIEDINQYADWDTKTTFYIICQDKYGNQPLPNQCSAIIRPSDFPSEVY